MALAQTTTNVPITAKFNYDDGTPVAATIAVYNDATNALVTSQVLDSNGKLALTVQLDPTVAYRVQGTDKVTGNPFPFMLKSVLLPPSIVQQIFTMLSTSEVDVVLAKADDSLNSYKLVPLPVTTTTVLLSSCKLSGPPGARFSNGVWSNTQPGTTWTCQISMPSAKTYTVSVTSSDWGTSTLQFQDPPGTTVGTMNLQDTNSWSFSTAVVDKAAVQLPAGSSTLAIVATKCCEQMSDTVTLQ